MELKFKPLLISFLAFIIIFAAAWVGYDKWLQPNQMQNKFSEMQYSYVDVASDISTEEEVIFFTILDEAKLQDAVTELEKAVLDTEYEDYTLKLKQEAASNYAAEAWESVQYDVYEMIVKASYSQIPHITKQINEQYPQLNASISMNEDYVFISLEDDKGSLHRLLPLQNQTVEVWNS